MLSLDPRRSLARALAMWEQLTSTRRPHFSSQMDPRNSDRRFVEIGRGCYRHPVCFSKVAGVFRGRSEGVRVVQKFLESFAGVCLEISLARPCLQAS